jgi:hypothetical protein
MTIRDVVAEMEEQARKTTAAFQELVRTLEDMPQPPEDVRDMILELGRAYADFAPHSVLPFPEGVAPHGHMTCSDHDQPVCAKCADWNAVCERERAAHMRLRAYALALLASETAPDAGDWRERADWHRALEPAKGEAAVESEPQRLTRERDEARAEVDYLRRMARAYQEVAMARDRLLAPQVIERSEDCEDPSCPCQAVEP